jgi:DNA-binding response OmpR family regulator
MNSRFYETAAQRSDQMHTHLPGNDTILVAVQSGLKDKRVLQVARTSLVPVTAHLSVSASLEDHPQSPNLIVLLGGWDELPLLEAVNLCRARFSESRIFAVIVGRKATIPELFAAGVSDCVRWPVASAEFTARARARLHPPIPEPESEIVLDAERLTVRCNGLRAVLTPGQFKILAQLLQRPARWLTGKELLKLALGETRTDAAQVRFQVLAIRRKLRHEAWRLRSHPKLGYFFEISRSQPTDVPFAALMAKKI